MKRYTALIVAALGISGMLGALGCRDLSNPTLPDGTQSPDTYHSREGGLMLSEAALRQFRASWGEMAINSGLLTDELTNASTRENPIDHRSLPEVMVETNLQSGYDILHKLRGQARLARAVLREYAPDLSPAVRGRLFAFEGYAEIWLADFFCSGIPLSTIDFNGDFTYQPPSTTEKVYAHAISLFDSALVLADDSLSVQTLAAVGKARALVALTSYEQAALAVANIEPDQSYVMKVAFQKQGNYFNIFADRATVSDREGGNGLPFRSSGDPRTASPSTRIQTGGSSFVNIFFPAKYPQPQDSNVVVVASGVEAQLIKAEDKLQREDIGGWLSMLNALRTSGDFTRLDTTYTDTTQTTVSRIDTVWAAGTGGVEGLRPLDDPGTNDARITLHFAERAAWLFVSGQRQGDLRRLVRNYGISRDLLYPVGAYSGPSASGTYGDAIAVPIPPKERRNPNFKGCLSRD